MPRESGTTSRIRQCEESDSPEDVTIADPGEMMDHLPKYAQLSQRGRWSPTDSHQVEYPPLKDLQQLTPATDRRIRPGVGSSLVLKSGGGRKTSGLRQQEAQRPGKEVCQH
ncbi:hypothetical protein Y1Q_0022194 [Alligator mississippiensis]|uniref:Uncharacterized protein n=1 Tax=Alligator mississippiensis TaxID=8496 RepID=A0A151P0Z0_ALLMI|nr:hypothetical protein Y1Q_0022194 [Alligator mississippiensis]